jgi:hypothetical protein
MPADFYIDTDVGIVFSRAVGTLTYEDAVGHMNRLLADPRFKPKFNQLFDFRSVTKLAVTHDETFQLAQRAVFSPQSRRAFVVSSDHQFGMGRIFGTYRDLEGEFGIQIFRQMREALEWLSLTEEPSDDFFPKHD